MVDNLLFIGGSLPGNYINLNPTVSYRFFFNFDENKLADFGITISNLENTHGQPDYQIGLTDAEPAEPKNRIRNFYLFAVVEDSSDGSSNQTAIRIHIHNAIQEIWMSPEQLTVYKQDFSTTIMPLRARFDDDVVAHIGQLFTPGQRLDYNITPSLTVQWSPDSIANTDLGWIKSNKAIGTYNISVKVTYKGVTKQASGKVTISEDLASTSKLTAELITTGQSPGFARLNQVPNILFLSDGFMKDQITNFNDMVNDYVSDLVTKKITSPFDILKGSVNYWKLFVPSREPGATYRGEVYVNDFDGLAGHPFPFIQNPKGIPVQSWTIEHLFFMVGLPVKAEGDNKPAAVTALFDKWQATTLLTAEQIAFLKSDGTLVNEWITNYAERRLPEGSDTAFGVQINDYTAAFDTGSYNTIGLDSNRMSWSELEDFLINLKDKNNNPIGSVFLHQNTNDHQRGKDASNIIMLSAAQRGRALNTSDAMFCVFDYIGWDTFTGGIADKKLSIAPIVLGNKLPPGLKGVISHELGHSFGLGDEYGEPAPLPGYLNKPVDDPLVSSWFNAKFNGSASEMDWTSNLQARVDLEDVAHQLKPAFIKWRYHRIQTVGIVTAISVNGNTVDLTLQPGQVSPFAVGDSVFIRKRKKTQTAYIITRSIDGNTTPVATIFSPDPLPPKFANEGTITAINTAVEKVTVRVKTSIDGIQSVDLTLLKGQAALLQVGMKVTIKAITRIGPIYTLTRNPSTNPGQSDHIEKAISPVLTVSQADSATNKLKLTISAGDSLSAYLQTLSADEVIIVYKPIPVVGTAGLANYPYAELISKKVLDYLVANPLPLNTNTTNQEIINSSTDTNIPASLIGPIDLRKKEIIGLYAGGAQYHGGVYHSAAKCMMRFQMDGVTYIELCAVCRYTLINLIDPTKFAEFDQDYMSRNIYPE